MDKETQIEGLLGQVAAGDESAVGRLMPLVYDELRALAGHAFRQGGSTVLQPTALIHEAYLRLARQKDAHWRGREHFMAVAATAMRQILIDAARKKHSQKRGGGWARVTLEDAIVEDDAVELVALGDALEALERRNPRHAKLVELKVLGGLDREAVARQLGVSPRTVDSDWRFVRRWLRKALDR